MKAKRNTADFRKLIPNRPLLIFFGFVPKHNIYAIGWDEKRKTDGI